MNIALLYPVPNETEEVWKTFKPFVQRFHATLLKHDAGEPYTLYLICSGYAGESELIEMFPLPHHERWMYAGKGFDIGACQWVGRQLPSDTLTINFTSRCFFHRSYWLTAYRVYRERFGPCLFGASTSSEGGKTHICTRAYAMDTWMWKLYPHTISSRDQGMFFECGDGCLTDFAWEHGGPVTCAFSGARVGCDPKLSENGFRRGDQSDMLVWDKHSDYWANAEPAEKERLTNLMLGVDSKAKAA